MKLKDGVSFLVFYKNTGIDLDSTIKTILLACEKLNFENFEIITIDDGSSPAYLHNVNVPKNIRTMHVRHEYSKGITASIIDGANLATFKYSLPTPGHDMFTQVSFENIIKLIGTSEIILGCRINLADSRPPVKRLASRVLRDLYRHLTFYYIGDIHGLFAYQTEDLIKYLEPHLGHANAVIAVTKIICSGGHLTQTFATVKSNHDDRPSRKLSDSIPSPTAVWTVIKSLFYVRRLVKGKVK